MSVDLSKLSDSDLMALKAGRLQDVSDDGLQILKGQTPSQATQMQKPVAPAEGPIERALGVAGRAIAPTLTGASLGSRFGPAASLV